MGFKQIKLKNLYDEAVVTFSDTFLSESETRSTFDLQRRLRLLLGQEFFDFNFYFVKIYAQNDIHGSILLYYNENMSPLSSWGSVSDSKDLTKMKNYLRNNKVVIRDCTKYSNKKDNPTRFSSSFYAGFQDSSPESFGR